MSLRFNDCTLVGQTRVPNLDKEVTTKLLYGEDTEVIHHIVRSHLIVFTDIKCHAYVWDILSRRNMNLPPRVERKNLHGRGKGTIEWRELRMIWQAYQHVTLHERD